MGPFGVELEMQEQPVLSAGHERHQIAAGCDLCLCVTFWLELMRNRLICAPHGADILQGCAGCKQTGGRRLSFLAASGQTAGSCAPTAGTTQKAKSSAVNAMILTEVLACRDPSKEHWADKSGKPGARLALHLLLRPQDAAERGRCASIAAAVAPPSQWIALRLAVSLNKYRHALCEEAAGSRCTASTSLPVGACLHAGARPAVQLALPVHCMQQLASLIISAAQPHLPTLQPSPLRRTLRTERLFCWVTTSPPV